MIEVYSYIKDLLKRDNVLKNFRVIFPDGDRADITNDQLIKETMKFEETLVSRVPVRFGICEANIISFQCIGVENIKRKRIHVQLEIDVSSLTSAQRTECGAETSADVPFPYYVLHYGDFIVTECERDTNLGIRKVVGTSKDLLSNDEFAYSMNNACAYDKRKLFYYTYSTSKTVNFNITNYILLQGGAELFNPGRITTSIDTEITGSYNTLNWGDTGAVANYRIRTKSGVWEKWAVSVQIDATPVSLDSYTTDKPCFHVYTLAMLSTALGYNETAKNISRMLYNFVNDNYIADSMQSAAGHTSDEYKWDTLYKFINTCLFSAFLGSYWNASNQKTNPSLTTWTTNIGMNTPSVPLNKYIMCNSEQVHVPRRVKILITRNFDSSDIVFSQEVSTLSNNQWLFKYPGNYDSIMEKKYITVTTQQVKIGNSTRYTPLFPILNINPKIYLQDMLELQGKFGGLGRDGEFREYTLLESIRLLPSDTIYPSDTLYPASEEGSAIINTDEFISASYDEYVFYYKGIYVTYKDTNNDDAEYQLLFDENDDNPDMPYYNVSSNNFISGGQFTEEQLIALIAPLVAILRKFRYYQSDIQMRALPYIEIGDTLFLRTRNDTIVTPTLQQTITGIQDLRGKIVSR